jgi:hypothetical protein
MEPHIICCSCLTPPELPWISVQQPLSPVRLAFGLASACAGWARGLLVLLQLDQKHVPVKLHLVHEPVIHRASGPSSWTCHSQGIWT